MANLGGTAVVVPFAARAQQKKMPVVGWLHTLSADRSAPVIDAFREGLREAGYTDGENIAIECRFAKALGLPVPQSLLVRADELVEQTNGTIRPRFYEYTS